MKGYKAFNKGLVYRGKQYAENAVFEEKNAEVCKKEMHFCKNLLDTLDYYPLIDGAGNVIEFAEVEALDNAETDDGKQFYTKKLKIGSKLSLSQFIKTSFNTLVHNIKSQVAVEISNNTELVCDSFTNVGDSFIKLIDGDYASFTGGDGAKLIGGDCSTLIGDNYSTLIGGSYAKAVGNHNAIIVGDHNARLVGNNDAKLIGGDGATLIGGNWAELAGGNDTTLVGRHSAKLAGGDGATVVGGDCATLTGGYNAKLVGNCCATLIGGNNSKLVGDYNTMLTGGRNAIIVGDQDSAAKGKKGSIIVLVERDSNLNIVNFKAVQVDGEKIKEDVLYKLENGELIQV